MTFYKTISHCFKIDKWAGKGFWAVMDRGFVATSNFILNILLARWLSKTEYGSFAVAYTIFLLVSTFHTSMFNEPMLVFGPVKYKDKIKTYLSVILLGHWIFCITVGIVFLLFYLALLLFTNSPLTNTFLGLSLASPFILFQWLMRRACYIELQPHLAAFAGMGYMAIIFLGALGLRYLELIGPTSTLIVMAIGSLFSGFWIYYKLEVYSNSKIEPELIRSVLKNHWRYGRWASGSSALAWIPGNVFMFLLPIWSGMEAPAAYKAILNLILPMINVNIALSSLLLPVLVLTKETQRFGKLVIHVSALLFMLTSIYGLLLWFFGKAIIQFLYTGHYSEYVGLLWITGLILIMDAIITISCNALQALELPNKVFLSNVASTGATLTVGVMFVFIWDVRGAMLGWLTALIVTGTIMAIILAPYIKPSGLKIGNSNNKLKFWH